MITTCEVCRTEFQTFPSRVAKNKGQFCGRKCYSKALSVRLKGAGHFMFGKKHSPEAMTKMRAAAAVNGAKLRGGNNPRFKGFWMARGYRFVSVDALPLGQRPMAEAMCSAGHRGIPEHRLVMAMAIGRPLGPKEVVHHRNGVKSDNRLENLEIHDSSTHKREHKEILRELRSLRAENEHLKFWLAMSLMLGPRTLNPPAV